MYKAGLPITARIRIAPEAVAWVTEQPWNPNQEIETLADGGAVLTLHDVYETEITPRVLSLGGAAEVLEPADFRERIKEQLQRMAAAYEGAVGAAVKGLVSCQGGVLNVALTKGRERILRPHPAVTERKETCMLRERLLPVRPGTIRETLARKFAEAFGFHGYYLCPNPPIPKAHSPRHVVAQ